MKTKKFDKKLVFNKQTVSNLDTMELGKIKGGRLTLVVGGPPSCVSDSYFPTCYTNCTCDTNCPIGC